MCLGCTGREHEHERLALVEHGYVEARADANFFGAGAWAVLDPVGLLERLVAVGAGGTGESV